MKNLYNAVYLCLLYILILIWSNTALAQGSKIIKLVAPGDTALNGLKFSHFGSFSFNDKEDLAFNGFNAALNSAICLNSQGKNSVIIAKGDSLPGIEKYDHMFLSSILSLNNQGAVAFSTHLPPVNGVAQYGLFLADKQGISKIIKDGDAAPSGTISASSLRSYSLNNSGMIAFEGLFSNPYRQAIFISNAGVISEVVVTGNATPIGGTFSFAYLYMWGFNDAGTVLFQDLIEYENDSTGEGIFTSTSGVISKVVARGDPSPDGKEFTYLDPASMNNLGDVVFEASVGKGFEVDYEGIFLYSGGAISLIAKRGEAAPGGGTFSVFSFPQINDEKQIVFQASIEGGTSAGGIFAVSNGTIQKVALGGETTPIGGSYLGFSPQWLNQGGSVAFSAFLNGGGSGIFLWNGGPRVEVSRDTVEFTDVVPGQTAKLEMEITNSGGKPLEVHEITASPSPPFGLENVASLPFSIEPGQKTQFLVTYSSPNGSTINLANISKVLQDGALTIKTNAPHQTSVIPIIAPKSTNLKVDIVASVGTEVKAGQFATIDIKVVDGSNNVITDFNGGATIRLLEDQSTPGITRLPLSQSVSISNGVAQSIFFYTPKEPFALDKPINKNTVLAGKAVIEVQLENSSIPAITKEIQVKSPLDFYIDSLEIQQGVKDLEKDVTLEFKPGLNRTFPALPFIAEHKTALRVFIKYNNPVPIPFSKIEELIGFSGELKIQGSNQQEPIKFTGPHSNQFIFRDSYEQSDKTAMMDGLFILLNPEKLESPGNVTLEAELKLEPNLDEAANEKANNKKSRTISLVLTNPLKILAAVGAYNGEPLPSVNDTKWDFIRDVYPIQSTRLQYNNPNTMNLFLNKGFHSGGPFFFMDMTKTLDRFNKENPADQRDIMVIFVNSELLNDICGRATGCTARFFSRISFVGALGSTSTVAHEVGHTLGLKDTYPGTFINGEPNPRRSNATNEGNRVGLGHIHFTPPLELTSISPSYIDFMGSVGGAWIDRVTWDYLYNTKFKSVPNNTIASKDNFLENFIAISGIISKTDSVVFNSFLTLSQVPQVSQSEAGDYSFEFLNSNGSPLLTSTFSIDFIMPDEGEVTEVPFSYYLPLPEGTSKLVMKKNGVEIAGRNFSTNAPAVQIISPQSGETITGTKIIQWTASDIDGDKLTYDIIYSSDGKNQQILAVNLTDTLFSWNSSLVPYSSSSSITVIANDGINESRSAADNLLIDSPTDVDDKENIIPTEYSLMQNYPNPFNPSTTISFELPVESYVTLKIYNIQGEEVKTLVDSRFSPGQHVALWDGTNNKNESASNGVYFIRIHAGEFVKVNKAVLMK